MNRSDTYIASACVLLVAGASFSAPQSEEGVISADSRATVMSVMLTEIMPASDTLWGVNSPETDAEWQNLVEAANDVISAFETIRNGGAGPNDNDWASEKTWQSYIDASVAAANKARNAGLQRDLDAMYEANDELYPPCESCHIDFNPGVEAEN